MIFAAENNRKIPVEDKVFGINNRAKERIAKEGRDSTVNATIGALLDDDGGLIILSSVDKVFKSLTPQEYAEYAPIGGTAGFREAVKKDFFRDYKPKRTAMAVATPGGTGAIRNTISNYSMYGDSILTADWFWGPYKTIAEEMGRNLETFRIFDAAGSFNTHALRTKAEEILEKSERLVIILNTPSHNPTGYRLTDSEWAKTIDLLNSLPKEKKITLLIDAAYIDFAGDEDESRSFIPILENASENIMIVIAHSLSKAYTLYGMRCGAMICMAPSPESAEEFGRCAEFSSRGTWSNCARAPQEILTKIHADPELVKKIREERAVCRRMLIRRGKAFAEEAEKAGLEILPFKSGFFITIPTDEPDAVSARLETEGIYTVPLSKGVRVAGSAVSESVCRSLPAAFKRAMR